MIILITILILLIILDAIGDGFRAIGKQKIHHVIEALMWLVVYLGFWLYTDFTVQDKILIGVFAVSFRVIFFNGLINKVMNKPWDYIGNSDPLWDVLSEKWRNGITLLSYLGLIISFVVLMSN